MSAIAESRARVSPLLAAAVLLLARRLAEELGLPSPSVMQILTTTGATRSRAYELCEALLAYLPALQRVVGRPPGAGTTDAQKADRAPGIEEIQHALRRFVVAHPGCVSARSHRQHYADAFRLVVLRLREQHAELPIEAFAEAVDVPLGTVKDWLATGCSVPRAADQDVTLPSEPAAAEPTPSATHAHIETVLVAWHPWCGTFTNFCIHVREHWRVPFGRSLIAGILEAQGLRAPRRRRGRSPDEVALRGAFETFFPGAQWVGDGTPITVTLDGLRFGFNLELEVDAYADAFVGVSFRDTEDSAAVIEAFRDGVHTTGQAPLANSLDSRPSNHTTEVDAALGDTLRIRATVGRPQNDAHVEGAFGLFQQTIPPIVLDTRDSLREGARQLLTLLTQTWMRAVNHRPRPDRKGLSRVDLYHQPQPTPDQIAAAHAALEERRRRQELARCTLEARQRPEVCALLDAHFARLGLLDPERHVRIAIARYPMSAIVDAIAIFEAKQRARTLPDGVDARYLLGIVRNIAERNEAWQITDALLRLRIEARDSAIADLVSARALILHREATPLDTLHTLVARAMSTDLLIERLFWLQSTVELIRAQSAADHNDLLRAASRHINNVSRVRYRERLDALRMLVDRVIELD